MLIFDEVLLAFCLSIVQCDNPFCRKCPGLKIIQYSTIQLCVQFDPLLFDEAHKQDLVDYIFSGLIGVVFLAINLLFIL